MAVAANVIILVLESIGLAKSAKRRGWKIFSFYTQLSNIVALLSSVFFLLVGERAAWLRYVSTCVLAMTFVVTLFVLVPMGARFRSMMLKGSGLYHHTLCPVLSVASYFLWEPHTSVWFVPVVLTFTYGMVMLYLNGRGVADGPYPFFRVRHQSALATVAWMAVLTGVITIISFAVKWLT